MPGTGPKLYSSGIVSSSGAERLWSGEGDFRAEVDVVGERMLLEEEDEVGNHGSKDGDEDVGDYHYDYVHHDRIHARALDPDHYQRVWLHELEPNQNDARVRDEKVCDEDRCDDDDDDDYGGDDESGDVENEYEMLPDDCGA